MFSGSFILQIVSETSESKYLGLFNKARQKDVSKIQIYEVINDYLKLWQVLSGFCNGLLLS